MSKLLNDFFSGLRWVLVENTSAEDVPAFGVMQVDGVNATTGIVKVRKPNGDGKPACLLNGPTIIPAPVDGVNQTGKGVHTVPWWALYDTGDGAPAALEVWGSGNASWKLRKGKAGFVVYGNPESGRVLAVRDATVAAPAFKGANVEMAGAGTTADGLTMAFGAVNWDTASYVVSNTFTVPDDGYYHIEANLFIASNHDNLLMYVTAETDEATWMDADDVAVGGNEIMTGGRNTVIIALSGVYHLHAGKKVSLKMHCTDATATLTPGDPSNFWIHQLSTIQLDVVDSIDGGTF